MIPDGRYGQDEYFAFIESMDPLEDQESKPKNPSSIQDRILFERRAHKLSAPSFAVWIDFIEAAYFMQLPWRNERCRVGNANDSRRRRDQLRCLDRSRLCAGLLFLNARGDRESEVATAFGNAAWHRVVLASTDGIPLITGPDYDLDGDANAQMRYLSYRAQCDETEFKALSNVFSLDFLANAKLDDNSRGSPVTTPPLPLPPGHDLKQEIQPISVTLEAGQTQKKKEAMV